MYDDAPYPYWYDEPPRGAAPEERIVHLVFLDGRLIDSSREDPRESRYADLAAAWDRELREQLEKLRPLPASPPRHQVVLEWLDGLVGGRSALLELTSEVLPSPGAPDLGSAPQPSRERFEAAWTWLQEMTELFGPEARDAARRLLIWLWDEDRDVLVRPGSTQKVVAGLVWVTAQANALFGTSGLTQRAAQEALGLDVALGAAGRALAPVVSGLAAGSRPHGEPEYWPTGRNDLLTSRTRRRLVRLRDQALEAAAVATAAAA